MLGALLPLTLASTAQTPFRWSASAAPGASASRYEPATQPLAYRTSSSASKAMPLAQGFNVSEFESLAAS
ncbi:MAG TPA: serine hydrolase, partial [Pseudoxanthomonas sp.]|nr:serine hydrolase [Pseudoxanthomonas sp.]